MHQPQLSKAELNFVMCNDVVISENHFDLSDTWLSGDLRNVGATGPHHIC